MLDIKKIRKEQDLVKDLLTMRGKGDFGIDDLLDLDEKRRHLLSQVEQMKNQQKVVSKQIPILKKNQEDTSDIMAQMKDLSSQIKSLDGGVSSVNQAIKAKLLEIPNLPKLDTPLGLTDQDNIEVKTYGDLPKFDFEPQAHWDLGTRLGIIDFERATKISGTRFSIMKGQGARLERALINFMLDLHTDEHGYEEILPPFMVNRLSMTGTGQLPKFENDMFHLPAKDYFLIPTAEVPLTNMYGQEILESSNLPVKHVAVTPCFRKEAGSAGRDTRGLIRVHQFNKVELVNFVHPEKSYEALERLLESAERVLQLLELPYRVVRLCGGDLGFSSAMTYDIEVWMPSYNDFLEISSCSNFEDYQARRAGIRFKDKQMKKPAYVHTLNGSGLAVGRTLAAILENYQDCDGNIHIPEVLKPYMNGKIIKK